MGDLVHLPIVQQRPRTRGDCENGPRPCPWVSCAHHLAIAIGDSRAKSVDFELDDLAETCTLDVAERGGASLEDVSELLGVTRERVRQIVERAILKLRRVRGRKRETLVELMDGAPMPDPFARAFLDSERSHHLEPTGADDADRDVDPESISHVWTLFENDARPSAGAVPVPETSARLEVACRSVWRAYMNASIADGFERGSKDPKFTESLASVEEHLARKNAEQPEEKTMAKRWTDNERDTCTEMIIERLRERGPANPKAIADAIGRKTPAVGRLLRELRDEKRIVHNGAIGRGALYGVVGTDFNVAQGERATVPAKKRHAPPPRAAAKVSVPRVRDLEGIKVSEGFGYKLRVNGVEVECPSAASVVELVRELAS